MQHIAGEPVLIENSLNAPFKASNFQGNFLVMYLLHVLSVRNACILLCDHGGLKNDLKLMLQDFDSQSLVFIIKTENSFGEMCISYWNFSLISYNNLFFYLCKSIHKTLTVMPITIIDTSGICR